MTPFLLDPFLLDIVLPSDNAANLLRWIGLVVGGTLLVFALITFAIVVLRRK